jgi:hypothetical protein
MFPSMVLILYAAGMPLQRRGARTPCDEDACLAHGASWKHSGSETDAMVC